MTAYRPPGSEAGVLRSTAVGATIGLDLLSRAVALASVIFVGAMAAGAQPGTMLMVLATLVTCLATVLRSRSDWPMVGAIQQAPLAVLLPVFFALSALPDDPATQLTATATGFFLLAAVAMMTGIAMMILSFFRLQRILRLLPYPVVAGFLAATGALLILAAIAGSLSPDERSLDALRDLRVSMQEPLVMTLGFAAVIGVLYRLFREMGFVFGVFGGVILFYVVLSAYGVSIGEARGMGLLPVVTAGPVIAPSPALLSAIDWQVVIQAIPSLVTAMLVAVLGLMLNVNGIELILERDAETEKMLSTAGVTNIALGLVGSTVAYVSSSSTSTARTMRATHPAMSVALLATLLVGFLFAGDIVRAIPSFVANGLLLFTGAEIMRRWFLSQNPRKSGPDWLIVGLIVAVSVVFGMLQAVAVGVLAASLIFAFTYGRLPIVTRETTLATQRSAIDRGPSETRALDLNADEVATLRLDGFLFFGSAEQVVTRIRQILSRTPNLRVLILDFQRVRGIDAAAVAALAKIQRITAHAGVRAVIAGGRPDVLAAIDRDSPEIADGVKLKRASSVDAALADAEELILSRLQLQDTETAESALTAHLGDAATTRALIGLMTPRDVRAGEKIIEKGQTTGEIYLIDSGRLGIYAPTTDGGVLRVRALGPGALVGEIASYAGLPRTADVIAETDCRVYVMDPALVDTPGRMPPQLAAAWHRLIAITLADKLTRTTRMLRDLG